jgi:hypothetical protein
MKTTIRRFSGALLFVAVALAVAGCGDPAPTTPTSIPDAVLTTDKFAGTLTTGGSEYHLFQARPGQVTMTLKGVGPDATVPIGMEIGVYSTLSCTAIMQNSNAKIGNQLVGLATSLTTLCVRVFDPGDIVADSTLTYELWVDHY